jgi:hypothetical protein
LGIAGSGSVMSSPQPAAAAIAMAAAQPNQIRDNDIRVMKINELY